MKSFKTELDPNNKQRTLLAQHAGAARFTYNWGLSRIKETYEETKKFPSAYDLHKELVQLKHSEWIWLKSLSKWAPQLALLNLEKALKRFLKTRKTKRRAGFPQFKSKKRSKQSFTLYGPFKTELNRIRVPKIGWLRLKESDYIPTDRPIKFVTLSSRAGRWFISALTEFEHKSLPKNSDVVGVDIGVKTLVALSDGTMFENPKPLIRSESKLRRFQKSLSRKQKGSANREKARRKLAQQHFRVSNVRKDYIHKMTDAITKRFGVIVVENLNVKGMLRTIVWRSIYQMLLLERSDDSWSTKVNGEGEN